MVLISMGAYVDLRMNSTAHDNDEEMSMSLHKEGSFRLRWEKRHRRELAGKKLSRCFSKSALRLDEAKCK